jgi:hypothetical protein
MDITSVREKLLYIQMELCACTLKDCFDFRRQEIEKQHEKEKAGQADANCPACLSSGCCSPGKIDCKDAASESFLSLPDEQL